MADLTVKEIKLLAHYRFSGRLEEVVTTAVSYAQTYRGKGTTEDAYAEAVLIKETVEAYAEQLADVSAIRGAASRALEVAKFKRDQQSDAFEKCLDAFFNAAGEGVNEVLSIIERHEYNIDRNKLLAELEDAVNV